eukprot:8354874-Alexandrium_andersonii.AAC.1
MGNTVWGVLARMLGQSTYPYAENFARTSEEDYRTAIKDHGYFERFFGAGAEKVPIGLMDKARLDHS